MSATTVLPRAPRRLSRRRHRLVARFVRRPVSAEDLLPRPPSDAERDLYFGPQHRWVPALSFVSMLAVLASISLFIEQRTWALFLAVPVAVNALGGVISVISSSRRRRSNYAEHRSRVANWMPDVIPSVDVLLPSAGEELAVLDNTYRAVAALQWPGDLRVTVLDDSARDEVRGLAHSYGFDYLVRPNRGHLKKAGNLLYGFERTSNDLILVLDADFVPRRDALYELVPYMDDPRNAIVQSPQFFDFHKRMNWVQHGAGATQVLFYRWVQPSRDKSDAAICVGTSALYRRAALARVGGFAQIGHSEDVHTGVKLMSVGHRVRYVPTVVTKGLCPDNFDQFVTQQYRWCTGSMSLLFSKAFHKYRFTLMQRLCYWSGFLYFIGTGVNIFAAAIPPVLMGLFAADAVNPSNYALLAVAFALRALIVPAITLGRSNFFSLARIQMTYSFSHGLALYDQLRRASDTWVATGAARRRSRTAVRVGRVAFTWCIAVQIALWAIVLVRGAQYGTNYLPLALLTVMNLWLVFPIIRQARGRKPGRTEVTA
jgi:cellulose synthase/poly-beta-1,6-N-acetylglucosamine synthase-like glycosyltransferase